MRRERDARRVWHGPFVRYAYLVMGAFTLDEIKVEHVAVRDACANAGVVATGVKLRISSRSSTPRSPRAGATSLSATRPASRRPRRR
jgi:hypothetical protein